MQQEVKGDAIISPDGVYRYLLERVLSDADPNGPTYLFIGVNPSTATASLNDATVRKWIGFCSRWGAARFLVGNVFAYRATDVRELGRTLNPAGPDNSYHLERAMARADVIIPCWGSEKKVPPHLRHRFDLVRSYMRASKKPVMCFGHTKNGQYPLHPLMLGYQRVLEHYQC